jgi:Transposase IS4
MKEKPGKYGILIRMLTDAKTRYIISMEPYAGKTSNQSNSAKDVVKRLIKVINNSGRNVTMDRYYTSVELAEDLWNENKLTVVGTLQTNRKHIPIELKNCSNRELYSSMFVFSKPDIGKPQITLVSYITREKPKRNLLMLSTQHYDNSVTASLSMNGKNRH